MKTLHTPAPRLSSRSSNGNIREGYATIASSSRRSPGGFGSFFNNTSAFGTLGSSSIPPVPSLPVGINGGTGGGGASDGPNSGVVRQPRGPTATNGFSARRERATVSESTPPRGFESRVHDSLEL